MPSSTTGAPDQTNRPSIRHLEVTASGNISKNSFTGNVLIRVNSVADVTLTIEAGIIFLEPLTIININSGIVTLAPDVGVTLDSDGGNLVINGTYSMVTVIPHPAVADRFWVVGNLTT